MVDTLVLSYNNMDAKERDNIRARNKRQKVAKLKVESGCIDCGYNKDSRALEFDHKYNSGITGTGKQRTVSSLMYSSWERIQEEIDKCDIVCCNCHSIRTMIRKGL